MTLTVYGLTPVIFMGTVSWFNRSYSDPSTTGNLEHIAREVKHLMDEEREIEDERAKASRR